MKMWHINKCALLFVLPALITRSGAAIYTYEDVELRRIFPKEFPQDTIRKTGSLDPEHLGRYQEMKSYFRNPTAEANSHFEELICYVNKYKTTVCKINYNQFTPEEQRYYNSPSVKSHIDRRRVYCFMLLCFNEDELDRIVATF